MQHVGRAAGIGRIDVARLQPHVVDHRHRPQAGRVAGAEIAVDVVLGEARILQRALGHLGVDLRQRDVLGEPRRMLVDAGNIGFALDAHRQANSPQNVAPHRERLGAHGKAGLFAVKNPMPILAPQSDRGPQQAVNPRLPSFARRPQRRDHIVIEPQSHLRLVLTTGPTATASHCVHDVRNCLARGSCGPQLGSRQRRVVSARRLTFCWMRSLHRSSLRPGWRDESLSVARHRSCR